MTRILNSVAGGNDRTVTRSIVTTEAGVKVLVSTIYLGIDHGFGGRPLWYETMVFLMDTNGEKVVDWGELDSNRYETESDAVQGHADMVMKWYANNLPVTEGVSDEVRMLASGEGE
jgi:hypothetical protein